MTFEPTHLQTFLFGVGMGISAGIVLGLLILMIHPRMRRLLNEKVT